MLYSFSYMKENKEKTNYRSPYFELIEKFIFSIYMYYVKSQTDVVSRFAKKDKL